MQIPKMIQMEDNPKLVVVWRKCRFLIMCSSSLFSRCNFLSSLRSKIGSKSACSILTPSIGITVGKVDAYLVVEKFFPSMEMLQFEKNIRNVPNSFLSFCKQSDINVTDAFLTTMWWSVNRVAWVMFLNLVKVHLPGSPLMIFEKHPSSETSSSWSSSHMVFSPMVLQLSLIKYVKLPWITA